MASRLAGVRESRMVAGVDPLGERPTMATSRLQAFLSVAAAAAHAMLANATYVLRELPGIGVGEPHRKSIAAVCSALVGTKHDVISELGELRDLDEPATSTLVQHLVERTARWLAEDLPQLHAVVEALAAARASDANAGIAYVLVAESAANVLRAVGQATTAATEYSQAVRKATSL